jgi:hypothetical protein
VNEALGINFPVTPAELHWGINLGKKIFASSKPFVIAREVANDTLLEADPEGKCVFIFEQFYKGEHSEVFERLETNASSKNDTE